MNLKTLTPQQTKSQILHKSTLVISTFCVLALCSCSPAPNPLQIAGEQRPEETSLEKQETQTTGAELIAKNLADSQVQRLSGGYSQSSSLSSIGKGITMSPDNRKVTIDKEDVHAEYSVVGRLSGNYRVFGGGDPQEGGGDNVFAHLDYFGMVIELARSKSIKDQQDCERDALSQSTMVAMIVPNPADLAILKGRKLDGKLHLEGQILQREVHNYKGSPIGDLGGFGSGPAGAPDLKKAWLITSIRGAN